MPPAKRNVNMVFQAYGLFPHMTVAQNVAFGLEDQARPQGRDRRARGRGAAHRAHGGARRPPARRSCRAASSSAWRLPAPWSTGRRRCCSTSRWAPSTSSCARRCSSSSSASTPRTGTTFVYVTHDQEEALTMSQRIAVMKDGVVQQVATPRELYERPANAFVAGFIGTSNVITVQPDVVRDGIGDHEPRRRRPRSACRDVGAGTSPRARSSCAPRRCASGASRTASASRACAARSPRSSTWAR